MNQLIFNELKKKKGKNCQKQDKWRMLEQHPQQYEEHDCISEDKQNTDDYG